VGELVKEKAIEIGSRSDESEKKRDAGGRRLG